nr:non-canonical non-ribosomal peptide synthetase fub8 [Quercus suber]
MRDVLDDWGSRTAEIQDKATTLLYNITGSEYADRSEAVRVRLRPRHQKGSCSAAAGSDGVDIKTWRAGIELRCKTTWIMASGCYLRSWMISLPKSQTVSCILWRGRPTYRKVFDMSLPAHSHRQSTKRPGGSKARSIPPPPSRLSDTSDLVSCSAFCECTRGSNIVMLTCPDDLRHVILTYACVKANCTSVFLSPKSSIPGALAVLEASNCNIWIKPQEQPTSVLIQDLLKERRMNVLDIPEVDELLNGIESRHFPFTKTFDEAASEAFCILHTSGSTGLPKPIVWSHALIGTADAVRRLPPTNGDGGLLPWTTNWKDGDRIYSSFPMSHSAGILMHVVMPALYRLHSVIGPAGVIPNIHLVDSLAEYGRIDIWSMVPSLVDELGETPDVLPKFKSSKFICASGGTTEGLFIGNLVVDREDWLYFAFHPYSGFEFRETEPGVYEQWIHRNEHAPLFQGIFHTFPDQTEMNLKDLYVKHPSKPNLWAYKGRNDDILVLSNGYKISPFDTEALITAHPAIQGCLMIGSGRPQAGLLIELKNPSRGGNDLFDSIWAIVEKADASSLHKGHLRKDFVTFADPERPFVRTDKQTIKRRATLELYAHYIDRFYSSREEEAISVTWGPVDTSSISSIQTTICDILVELAPEMKGIAPNQDLFSQGLDSLLVFSAVKSIRVATGLDNRLSTRHFYANPTVSALAAQIVRLVKEQNRPVTNGTNPEESIDPIAAKVRTMIAMHKSRLSPKVSSFDGINDRFYVGMNCFIPLRDGISFSEAFQNLEDGLRLTMQQIPELEGKIMFCSEDEIGYWSNDMRVTFQPLFSAATSNITTERLRQLRFNDLSDKLPSFEALQATGFAATMNKDDLFLQCPIIAPLPADVLVAQANFINGGCVLAVNMHHALVDGMGLMTAITLWAENCRFAQGDTSATHDWLDAESMNPKLPEILHEVEGYTRQASDVDPGVWRILDSPDPKELPGPNRPPSQEVPAPPAEKRQCRSAIFLISSANLEKLRQEVLADPEYKGTTVSIGDIVQAFFWQAVMKIRYRVATEIHGEMFSPEDRSIVEVPVDARPYFSSHFPPSYMHSFVFINRLHMSLKELCSPKTSIARIALVLREAASRINSSLVHDTYTVLRADRDIAVHIAARMRRERMYAMLNNMMLFQTGGIEFGGKFFADRGALSAMRFRIDWVNTIELLVILPMRKDGGVELLLGAPPEELDMLMKDEMFGKYASFMG